MYVVVPLSKPRSVRGRTAPSPRIPAITGTAAATAASKRSSRFAIRAASCSAFHSLATSSLFAVTRCFFRSNAPRSSSSAGSVPPMTSITMAISGSSRIACGSVVTGTSPASRTFCGSRTAAATRRSGRPAAASIRRERSANARATAEPTVPSPRRPTPTPRALTCELAVALGGTESRTHVRWGRNKAPKPSSHLIELFVGPLLVVDVVTVLSTDNNVIEGSHAPKEVNDPPLFALWQYRSGDLFHAAALVRHHRQVVDSVTAEEVLEFSHRCQYFSGFRPAHRGRPQTTPEITSARTVVMPRRAKMARASRAKSSARGPSVVGESELVLASMAM